MDTIVKDWAAKHDIPEPVLKLLISEGFCSLQVLLNIETCDIESLKIPRGHFVMLRTAVKDLQRQNGGGPLTTADSPAPRVEQQTVDVLAGLLSGLKMGEVPAAKPPAKGEPLRIVDFVPASAMVTEAEEVSLGGGVTIKMNTKPKLEKVSPSAWIVANSRILAALMAKDSTFDVAAYLKYTEMIGELGCRFTWHSVLLFDEEYRQRQTAEGFPWGTDAPHLATVVLRDRASTTTAGGKPKSGGGGNNSNGQRPRRPVGPTGKEVCMQYNRGACTYGLRCVYDHACSSCGKDHPATQHPAAPSNQGTA